jgi:hypothetical protein
MGDSIATDRAEPEAAPAEAAAALDPTEWGAGEAQALRQAVCVAETATQSAMDRLERVLRDQGAVAARGPFWRRWLTVALGWRRWARRRQGAPAPAPPPPR